MRCSGGVGADGTSGIVVWPRGQARGPGIRARTDGLTLELDAGCVGCQAGDACPFFPAFARGLSFPCGAGVPSGETVVRLRPRVALFSDPPGVAGLGWPSGGPDPANGVVGINGNEVLVYRSTCTLPARENAICTTSLNDVISRYG